MNYREWEELCDGCAKCCDIGGGIACPKLHNKKCTVYKNRFNEEPCVYVRPSNVMFLHKIGTLPDTCGYVRYMQGLPKLEEVPEYNLIPFNMASKEIIEKHLVRRQKELKYRGVK